MGAFWQPNAVLCDTETLASLPPREWACGRGEIAKYAFLGDAPRADQPIEEQVARCAGIKAAVVSEDEREGVARVILNYGHTLAHALEGAALAGHDWDLRHGEAVAIGLLFAAELAQRLDRIDEARVTEHRAVIASFDLRRLPARRRRRGAAHVHGAGQEGAAGPHLRARRPRRRRGGARRGGRRRGRYPGRHGCTLVSLVLLLRGPTSTCSASGSPTCTARHPCRPREAGQAAAGRHGLGFEHVQSNHEGELIEAVHGARARADALVINAGALSHTSWSLHDAVAAFDGPVVELTCRTRPPASPSGTPRCSPRSRSGLVAGFGGPGYELAIDAVAALLKGAAQS